MSLKAGIGGGETKWGGFGSRCLRSQKGEAHSTRAKVASPPIKEESLVRDIHAHREQPQLDEEGKKMHRYYQELEQRILSRKKKKDVRWEMNGKDF